jgi:hypothetical protein
LTNGYLIRSDGTKLVPATNTDAGVSDAVNKKHDAVTLGGGNNPALALSGQALTLTAGSMIGVNSPVPLANGGWAVTTRPHVVAHDNAARGILANQWNLVYFAVVEYDATSAWKGSYYFQPGVNGLYQINSGCSQDNAGMDIYIGLFKNGALYKMGKSSSNPNNVNRDSVVSGLVPLTGSSYVSIYLYPAVNCNTQGNDATKFWFDAHLVYAL